MWGPPTFLPGLLLSGPTLLSLHGSILEKGVALGCISKGYSLAGQLETFTEGTLNPMR